VRPPIALASDRAEEQRVGAEGGDDRVQAEAPDEEAVQETRSDREGVGQQNRREHLAVVAVRDVRHDDHGEPDRAGNRQVEAGLLHDQHLSEPRDAQHRGEGQHAENGARGDARGRDDGAEHDENDDRHEHRDQPLRGLEPRAAEDAPLRILRHYFLL
jgi:hypothetical protein